MTDRVWLKAGPLRLRVSPPGVDVKTALASENYMDERAGFTRIVSGVVAPTRTAWDTIYFGYDFVNPPHFVFGSRTWSNHPTINGGPAGTGNVDTNGKGLYLKIEYRPARIHSDRALIKPNLATEEDFYADSVLYTRWTQYWWKAFLF